MTLDREPHKRMHWHPYRHRHTRNSQQVRTETGSLHVGQGSAPNVHGVLRGSDIHHAVPVVAASERAALGVSGNTTRLYADAQVCVIVHARVHHPTPHGLAVCV